MKEVDFLPEWYKSRQRRQNSYRAQYIVIMCIFIAMVTWSFITAGSLSNARAQLNNFATSQVADEKTLQDFAETKRRLIVLERKAAILKRISSRISISKVLAEVSFLTDKRIILSTVEIKAENNVRFKVVIRGLAASTADAARFIQKLEDSAYFCRVVPGFLSNKKVNGYRVTDFEINCYIANYIEE